ncbi:YeiH family protein [Marinobacter koreensis]|uniref:YeiH family protein n=1 Tax=Marinobacter koreensis TaxID=335974 RepID=A0ABW0RTA6_9GAMM|nr:YeiH family protein [Marinobacter koreensis]MCK7548925.1 YeiH family protein [Marinobacter koreensis]
MWPGLGLCALLTLGGFTLSHIPFIAATGISPLVLSLALGVLAGNLPWFQLGSATAGLAFSTRWLLRGGIVLFGFSITLQQVFSLGPGIVLLDMVVITTIITIGYLLGTRLLKLDPETALLTSAGSAICGAAAVLATEATIRSKPAATAMAVATVVLFGSLAMVVYPLLYPIMGWDQGLFGVYIGATIHEVAQVVAAGGAVGTDALANAVVVKLVRVMLLVPFLLIVGQWWVRRKRQPEEGVSDRGKLTIPWFAFGFVAAMVLNSLLKVPAPLHSGIALSGQVALAMAMGALGYETRLEKLQSLGLKPMLLALILFALLLTGGMIVTPMVM